MPQGHVALGSPGINFLHSADSAMQCLAFQSQEEVRPFLAAGGSLAAIPAHLGACATCTEGGLRPRTRMLPTFHYSPGYSSQHLSTAC